MTRRLRLSLVATGCVALAALFAPAGVAAYQRLRDHTVRTQLSHFLHTPLAGDTEWVELPRPEEEEPGEGEEEGDDARRRQIASRILWGAPTPEATAHLARLAHAEARRWAPLLPGAPSPAQLLAAPGTLAAPAPATGAAWVNLGPTDADFQWNGTAYTAVDSGRITGILAHPTEPGTLYVATAGGGLWKTFTFDTAQPVWHPVSETLGNLAIGAVAMDPTAPETLYVGLGDAFDTAGGQVVKSTTGAASWEAPVTLAGTYPAAAGGLKAQALRVRELVVDPANPALVLAGTDVGLFRSTDAGASFQLVDLPNAGGARAEAVWSIVFTGQVGGVSRWVLSGVYACGAGLRPNDPGYGDTCPSSGQSTPGDIWVSQDAGATWQSRRAAGALPSASVGRITLGAGTPSGSPPRAVVYAQLGTEDDTKGMGYWRSTDSGLTWASASGTLSNPTKRQGTTADCASVSVNGEQAFYNAGVAVDPADAGNVLVGGMLCGLRTRSGQTGPTWENVSHWMPSGGGGDTSDGRLPYVHADWHRVLVVRTAQGTLAFAGTDGGLYVSSNLFTAASGADVQWRGVNRGLVTHLAYSVASGDPATGNPSLAFAGLQDNGTRMRVADPARATTFNQVIGGDGFGTAAGRDVASGASVYWASVNGSRQQCVPSSTNAGCNQGGAFSTKNPTPLSTTTCEGEGQPFLVRYAPVPAHPLPNTFLTATNLAVHRVSGTGSWQAVSGCLPGYVRNLHASPSQDGLYGAALSGGLFAVTSNCTGSTTACTWTQSSPLGFDVDGDGRVEPGEALSYTSMVAFPPVTPDGKTPGDVYVVSSAAPVAQDGQSLVPDALGHLFITSDRGRTWRPLHGNGSGADLPNVGVNVVRYDPSDTTNRTLYVGTQLGVYRTTDGGDTWQRYGTGLPLVSVTDMVLSRSGALMRVATYGRGLWELSPSDTAEHGVPGNGDFDRDQQLDFIDLAAMASRLGTTPGAAAQPQYDWNTDMTGTVNAVDEADLSALLGKLGGRP